MSLREVTVVQNYSPSNKSFGSEGALLEAFFKTLEELGYEIVTPYLEEGLIENLRLQLEKLNDFQFTNNEWNRFFKEVIASGDHLEKIEKIQGDNYIKLLRRDDGTDKNVYLICKHDLSKNTVQVVKRMSEPGRTSSPLILVNGFPMVHIELKKKGTSLKETFNNYTPWEDPFWTKYGLFEYIHIFVISDGEKTRYYSGTNKNRSSKGNFELTYNWSSNENEIIGDLIDFTKYFLSKSTLLNVLIKYCVFNVDKQLMIMRPYQIAAAEKILYQITDSLESEDMKKACGYIWHTTGSGKTLTSFKASKLAMGISGIDKVLFVVDRKDLDYQTQKEYDHFQKGCVTSIKNSQALKRSLESEDLKIIVTTIQKLSNFISRNPEHPIYGKKVVMIFDECHRSQAGEMLARIKDGFTNAFLFGFTGTPIFTHKLSNTKTTEKLFGDVLHKYTIVDAIRDENVISWTLFYPKVSAEGVTDENAPEELYEHPKRIESIVDYILENFDIYTVRQSQLFSVAEKRRNGFNAIFATASVKLAKEYYNKFKERLAALPPEKRINVAVIFSDSCENPDIPIEEEEESDITTESLSSTSSSFLKQAIEDYNEIFKTNFDIAKSFDNYYKDVARRVKEKEIDLLIVVNMMLTGFDAKQLNTLFVDKGLSMHNLIQAFSRTNRIFNEVKKTGNIVYFRDLRKATDAALKCYSEGHDKNSNDEEETKIVNDSADYPELYEKYEDAVHFLVEKYPLPMDLNSLSTKEEKNDFILANNAVFEAERNLLCYPEFHEKDENLISDKDLQEYKQHYLALKEERDLGLEGVDTVGDEVSFYIELLQQIEVNLQYILQLVDEYKVTEETNDKKDILMKKIQKLVGSSPTLRNKKFLIDEYCERDDVSWEDFVVEKYEKELNEIVKKGNLNKEKTIKLMNIWNKEGCVKDSGIAIDEIMPPMSRRDRRSVAKKASIIKELRKFFHKYFDVQVKNQTNP